MAVHAPRRYVIDGMNYLTSPEFLEANLLHEPDKLMGKLRIIIRPTCNTLMNSCAIFYIGSLSKVTENIQICSDEI